MEGRAFDSKFMCFYFMCIREPARSHWNLDWGTDLLSYRLGTIDENPQLTGPIFILRTSLRRLIV